MEVMSPIQLKKSKNLLKKLKKHGIALFAGEPRSGKTRVFLKVTEQYQNVLVVTQKNALPDVILQASLMKVKVTITNFHQVKNLLKSQKFDLIVVDEAHRWVGGFPKFSQLWRELRSVSSCSNMIFSSGTLTPETYANLYPMLALSYKSPWKKFKTFNKWFAKYGKLYTIEINDFKVRKYNRTKEKKIFKDIKKLIVTFTREEAGHTHEPVDKLHQIGLPKEQLKFIKKMLRDRFIENKTGLFMGDTPASLGQKLHQVGGGFVKGEDRRVKNPKWVKGSKKKMRKLGVKKYLFYPTLLTFKENPKIDYIKKHFDPNKTIILAYYKAEQDALAKIFPHTGSTTKNAEGVDYSDFEHMVIYSHSHSSGTYQQVRVRQANLNRKSQIIVNFLITNRRDEKVYNIASGKEKYTRRWYE